MAKTSRKGPRKQPAKLAQIARDVGRTEKSARQKMRKYYRDKKLPGVPKPTGDGRRWLYDPKDVEAVKQWLALDRRKEDEVGTNKRRGVSTGRNSDGSKDKVSGVRQKSVVVRVRGKALPRAQEDKGGSGEASGTSIDASAAGLVAKPQGG